MINRRSFLKGATGVAAATAVPYFWTGSRAIAAESKDDRLRVAAVGVGGRGSQIAAWAAELGEMVACCDVDRRHAERFSAALGGKCEILADYRKLLVVCPL